MAQFLANQEEVTESEGRYSNRSGASSSNLMGLMMFMDWKSRAESCLARYDLFLQRFPELIGEVDEEPGSATLARNRSLKHTTLSVAAEGKNVPDGLTIDSTDADTLAKTLTVNVLRPLGQTLGEYLRAEYELVQAELAALTVFADQQFWVALGIDFGKDPTSIFLMQGLKKTVASYPVLG